MSDEQDVSQQRRGRVGNVIGTLADLYGRKLSTLVLEAYETALSDLSVEEVERAAAMAIRSLKFMPVPAELRQYAGTELSAQSRAIASFAKVDWAVRHHGSYRTVEFDDLWTNATISWLGGWVNVCCTPDSEFDSFFRDRYIKTYTAVSQMKSLSSDDAGPQRGLFERSNSIDGHGPPQTYSVVCGLPPVQVKVRKVEGFDERSRIAEERHKADVRLLELHRKTIETKRSERMSRPRFHESDETVSNVEHQKLLAAQREAAQAQDELWSHAEKVKLGQAPTNRIAEDFRKLAEQESHDG